MREQKAHADRYPEVGTYLAEEITVFLKACMVRVQGVEGRLYKMRLEK